MYLKYLSCFTLIILNLSYSNTLSIEDAEDIISFTTTVVKSIYRAWETFGPESDDSSLIFKTKRDKVLDSLDRVTRTVQKIEEDLPQTSAAMIKKLERDLSGNIRLDNKLDDLVDTVHAVVSSYEIFTGKIPALNIFKIPLSNEEARSRLEELLPNLKHEKSALKTADDNSSSSDYESFTLLDFANSVITYSSSSVRKHIDRIHEMIVPKSDTTINLYQENRLLLIKEHFNSKLHCAIDQSLQQMIYNLFASLRIAQLKGLIMMQYSYMILRLHNKGNFSKEKLTILNMFNERFKQQLQMVKQIIDDSDNSFWKCDPMFHRPGKTYTEFTRLLQGYVQNENDLSKSHNCYHGCDYYKYVDHFTCTKDSFCVYQPPCKGKLVDCTFVDEDLSVCMANAGSTRRYESIKALSKQFTLGKKDQCRHGYSKKAEFWRKILIWKCYYCLCLCDEESLLSDRYFNLQGYTSDVYENKVVTGVRFVKHNRIIHLQIQQAVLQTKGSINKATQEWVPLSEYTINTGTRGVDYHALSFEERALDLDDHIAPPKHAVTGVRFRLIGAHINLEVQVTPFNLETGVLSPERSQWAGNDNTDASEFNPRNEIRLQSLKLPTDSVDSEIDVQGDSFLQFTHSDKDTDAWQSTVPYFDAQNVVPNPPTVLSGLGITHKGPGSTAGFITPRVYTYNLGERLDYGEFNLN